MLASDEVNGGLVDESQDQVHLPPLIEQELIDILLEDTREFSRQIKRYGPLFVFRTASRAVMDVSITTGTEAVDPAAAELHSPSWRTGASGGGKRMYRAALLDLLWAKHKLQPKR